jgi:hypothetical protein
MRCKTCNRIIGGPEIITGICLFCNTLQFGDGDTISANAPMEQRYRALQLEVAQLMQWLRAEKEGGLDILPILQSRI